MDVTDMTDVMDVMVEHAQGRRFARAVGPEQGRDLPVFGAERHVVHGVNLAK